MNSRKIIQISQLIIIATVIALISCSSPLMDIIKEEVEVVVTPPFLETLFPEANETDVAIDIDNIVIDFTKNISSSSVNSSTISIVNENNVQISGSYTVSGRSVTFNPSNNLSYDELYTVSVNTGLVDTDGNNINAGFSWSFTTTDAPSSIKPQIQYVRVNEGALSTNSPTIDLEISATDYDGDTQNLKSRYLMSGSSDWTDWLDMTDGILSIDDLDLGTTDNGTIITFSVETKDNSDIRSDIFIVDIEYETTAPSIVGVNWDDEAVFPYNGSTLQIIFDEQMGYTSFDSTTYTLEKVSDSSSVPGIISLVEANEITESAVNLWGLSLSPNSQYKITLQSDITDAAGPPLGGDALIWYFNTGEADDTTAPDGTIGLISRSSSIVTTLPTGAVASNSNLVTLDLSQINDDYSSVWGMRFWGENDGSENNHEDILNWEDFPSSAPYERNWNLSASAGSKFILYRLSDSAGNDSDVEQIKVFLDNEKPLDPTVTINGGTGLYTNNAEALVDIEISASDAHTGLEMMYINDGTTNTNWVAWSPLYSEWELPDIDGIYTITVNVRDYLDQAAANPGTATIVLDRQAPSGTVNFN